jgi:hypothetical protein
MNRSEILSKEFQRRELVELKLQNGITREQLDALHILDREVCGYDVVGLLFDEVESLRLQLATALKAGGEK